MSCIVISDINSFSLLKRFVFVLCEHSRTSTKKCVIPSCTSDSLALTAYCFLHITLNTDQRLFHPCTAKFADNSQCRVPVFDISHELPLCREHAWKRVSVDFLNNLRIFAYILTHRTTTIVCYKNKNRKNHPEKNQSQVL